MLSKSAEGVRETTLVGYRHHIELLIDFLDDPDLDQVTTDDVRAFLNYLRFDYRPTRFGGNGRRLSDKSIRNAWITLSA